MRLPCALVIAIVTIRGTASAAPPPDPERVLLARGERALRAHDLVTAAATFVQVAATGDDYTRADAHYDLGLVGEARTDRAAAIAEYETAMKLWPHRRTRARLAALDPIAGAAADPFAPALAAGPFPSLAAATSAVDPGCGADHGPQQVLAPGKHGVAGAMRRIAIVQGPCEKGQLRVAVELAAGWYVATLDVSDTNLMHCGTPTFRFGDVAMHGTVAAIAYRGTTGCSHRDEDYPWNDRGVFVLGVGPSGTPSAVPRALPLVGTRVSWRADGSFELTGRFDEAVRMLDTGVDDAENVRGWHALRFP